MKSFKAFWMLYASSSMVTHRNDPLLIQVLSLITVLNGFIVPVLYCLFERKTFLAYQSILMHLASLNPQLSPECVIIGFDGNLAAAWNAQFPGTICVYRTSYHFIYVRTCFKAGVKMKKRLFFNLTV